MSTQMKSRALRGPQPLEGNRPERQGSADRLEGLGGGGDADHPAVLNWTTFATVSPPTWSAQASMTGLRRSNIEER